MTPSCRIPLVVLCALLWMDVWGADAQTAATPVSGLGGSQAGTMPQTVSDHDQRFVTAAAIDDLFEVKSAQVALSLGVPKLVHDYALLMVDEHQFGTTRLAQIAKDQGDQLPTELDADRQHDLDGLEKFQGDDFVTLYDKGQRRDYDQVLALYQDEVAHGHDRALMDFAQGRLAMIHHYRDMVDGLPGLTDNGNGSGNVPQAH